MKLAIMSLAVLTLAWGASMMLFSGQGSSAQSSEPGSSQSESSSVTEASSQSQNTEASSELQQATFGGGCFWCVEAVFEQVEGVRQAYSGYAGGSTPNPTYKQVSTGTTGHAEVVQITYDPSVISYPELLEIFWKTHDPTTPNRQGADVGPQYRSIILHHNDEQRQQAERYKAKLDESGAFNRPIVTEIEPLQQFYPAEAYHQEYFEKNPRQAYCQYVIVPKLEKFKSAFRDKLKGDSKSSND